MLIEVNIGVLNLNFKKHEAFDLAALVVPKEMKNFLQTFVVRPQNVVSLDRLKQTTTLITRNDQWFATVASHFVAPGDGDEGEALYDCSTEKGDCGAIVWKDPGFPIGFHVGTSGEDTANRFIFFSELVHQFLNTVY
jgi:hypothetical protein